MSKLEIDVNRFETPDLAYRMLIEAHRGLSEEESAALNARLILILANQIGDVAVLRAALALARQGREATVPQRVGRVGAEGSGR
jgi:hypothetical protein